MKAVVSFNNLTVTVFQPSFSSDTHGIPSNVLFKVILPFLVATAFAAPQYGATPQYGPAPQTVEVSPQVSLEQWGTQTSGAFASAHIEPAQHHVQAAAHASTGSWGGSPSSSNLQIRPRPQMEEIQRQWEQFIE